MKEMNDLFSPEYAEISNQSQLSPVPEEQSSLAGKCNTDGCFSFLPAAGNSNGSTVNNAGTNGNYWSCAPNSGNTNNSWNLNFNSGNLNPNNNNRNNGFSVRCVSASTTEIPSASSPVFSITASQLLEDLLKAYYDARRNKRNTRNQLRFEVNLEENLVALRDELFNRTYKVGRSTCFIIEDPVKREIFAADFRDRVVHHLVYNYIAPIFERTFIADSYSCRKGKGTLYGVKRLEHHIRSCSQNYTRPCYVMKMDIQGYFMNINRNELLATVKEDLLKFAPRKSDVAGKRWDEKLDYSLILPLLEEIILTDPTQNCIVKGSKSNWDGLPPNKSLFHTPADCGLPIGNLTSQLFSNIKLNKFDQFVKRELRQRHYGRYGISYLGVFVKPYRLYIDNKTLRRIKRKTNLLHQCIDAELLRASINSYLGYLKHLKCTKIKKALFEGKEYLKKFGEFDWGYSKFELLKTVGT